MKARKKVNPRIDRKVFAKTAGKTHVMNIPGKVQSRGGTRL